MGFWSTDWNDAWDDDSPIGISSSMKEYIGDDYYCTENNTMSNDRFKFRVWDKKRNCYHTSDNWLVDQNGQLWFKGAIFESGNCEDFTVEQCTGIRDRNGKLIFEGDILRATLSDGKYIDYPVGWWDGAFHLYYVDKSLIAETGTIQFCLRGLVSVKNCCYREIIGNIHESDGKDE